MFSSPRAKFGGDLKARRSDLVAALAPAHLVKRLTDLAQRDVSQISSTFSLNQSSCKYWAVRCRDEVIWGDIFAFLVPLLTVEIESHGIDPTLDNRFVFDLPAFFSSEIWQVYSDRCHKAGAEQDDHALALRAKLESWAPYSAYVAKTTFFRKHFDADAAVFSLWLEEKLNEQPDSVFNKPASAREFRTFMGTRLLVPSII